jgi:hypothetical protein
LPEKYVFRRIFSVPGVCRFTTYRYTGKQEVRYEI